MLVDHRLILDYFSSLKSFPYFEFAAYSLVGVYVWETFLNFRQRGKLREVQAPAELVEAGVTTQKDYVAAQLYGLDKNSFTLIKEAFTLLSSFVYLGLGYSYLWNWSGILMNYAGYSSDFLKTQSLVFIYLMSLVGLALDLPFKVYFTFVLEERHGFNRTTVMVFITDIFKETLVSFALIGILLPSILAIIDWAGDNFYIYVGIFFSIFQLIMMWVYPTLIMPLFNKFDPLPQGSLRDGIEGLASSVEYPLTKLFVMDGSKRSGHSNAFMYGLCSNKRIVLFDTLLEKTNERETLAILAHELGHWKFSHTIKQLVIIESSVFVIMYFFAQVYKDSAMYRAFGFQTEITMIGLLLFSHLVHPISVLTSFLTNALTRSWEFQADQYAITLGYPQIYDGLVKISKDNKSTLNPDWLYSSYHYTHPPLIERLRAIQESDQKNR